MCTKPSTEIRSGYKATMVSSPECNKEIDYGPVDLVTDKTNTALTTVTHTEPKEKFSQPKKTLIPPQRAPEVVQYEDANDFKNTSFSQRSVNFPQLLAAEKLAISRKERMELTHYNVIQFLLNGQEILPVVSQQLLIDAHAKFMDYATKYEDDNDESPDNDVQSDDQTDANETTDTTEEEHIPFGTKTPFPNEEPQEETDKETPSSTKQQEDDDKEIFATITTNHDHEYEPTDEQMTMTTANQPKEELYDTTTANDGDNENDDVSLDDQADDETTDETTLAPETKMTQTHDEQYNETYDNNPSSNEKQQEENNTIVSETINTNHDQQSEPTKE